MPAGSAERGAARAWRSWVCLWVVYVVWGSTYLAIRVQVRTLPPLMAAGTRFLIAGVILYVVLLVRRGRPDVPRSELVSCTIVGILLFLGANGLVGIAEQEVPSSLAALIISSIPLWVVVYQLAAGGRVDSATLIGVVMGFAGVALLVLPGTDATGATLSGVVLLVIASSSWALGSFLSTRRRMPSDLMVSSAYQMMTGGIAALLAGVIRGEASGLERASWSGASLAALAYLTTIGSLVAFTAYAWLLQNEPISKVATHAYVNPVVAVLLGWLILDERVSGNTVAGATVIVGAVAFVVRRDVARRQAVQRPAAAVTGADR